MDFKELLLPILKSLLSRINFSNLSSVKRALQIAANIVDAAGQDEVAAILRSDELANVVESHYRLYAFVSSQYGANTVQAIDWQPLLQMLLPILMDLIRRRLGAKQVAAEAACEVEGCPLNG